MSFFRGAAGFTVWLVFMFFAAFALLMGSFEACFVFLVIGFILLFALTASSDKPNIVVQHQQPVRRQQVSRPVPSRAPKLSQDEKYKILEKLPSYIKPLGLGEESYPKDWLTEKKGENISSLNKYYAEFTGLYWVWKNRIKNLNKDDLIGNCHNRVLWLDNIYTEKQKFSLSNLYSNLLKPSNDIFDKSDVILLLLASPFYLLNLARKVS